MARVICKLPNCATEMTVGTTGGTVKVKFVEDRKQFLSEEVSDEVADHLDAIPGFTKVAAKPKAKPETADEKAAREAAEAEAAETAKAAATAA